MDVKSVNHSATAQPPKAQRVQEPTPEQKKARAQQEQPQRTQEHKPQPVVNAQGHTTGRLVNTTA
jgi:hypothetical protein